MADSEERLRQADLTATTFDPRAADGPPARARAVVVGAGIVGASVALHLAELGWTDTVVIERDRVSCGTSWHAAGLMTPTRGTHVLTEVATYSRNFYERLADRSGVDVGFHEHGSLSLAQTRERMTELNYALTMAHHHDLSAERLTPLEIAAISPLLDVEGLVGGVLFAGDVTVNPGVATHATAKAAFDLGVRIVEGTRVTGFRLDTGRVVAVETDRGPVECEVVVIAAGLWSRDLALTAGARLALHAAEHFWVQTEPIAGATRDLPILRDLDGHFYVRHYRGGLIVGAFEPDGKPRATSTIPPDFSFAEFAPDWDHFELPLSKARRRVPALREARFAHFLDAPESFTPDGAFLLGETAEVAGLYVAAGLNSQGIIFGPGVGRALAEWIDAGAPPIDVSEVDVRRFAPVQANASYLFERTRESLGRLYAMHWPFLQPETARGLRRGPLYDRLAAAGACFGETAGWERANWYAPPGDEPVYRYSYGRQNWFDAVGEEHRAAREAVALLDLSSFAKIRVEGPAALEGVQRVFAADLDREPGSITYTCMLNRQGGIELDGTVTRLADETFLVIAPTATQTKVFHWLRRHLGGRAVATDVTSGVGVLAVTGPRSRDLLSRLTDADLSGGAFPFATAQELDIGWATVLALRLSFAGELGWELHVPAESLATLYDELVAAGADLGLRHAGYHALDGLRAEKGYLAWGADIGPADTPFETGLAATVALNKATDFVGRAALAEAAGEPPRRRLVHLGLDQPEPLLHGGESLLLNGELVGRVTSGAFGHSLGVAVGLAFLEPPDRVLPALDAGRAEVEIAAEIVPATISERPFYDPGGLRLRG
jgi:glycine cleavage system aminomethyltransferase T/glycine/D-amino acid oxidase-like deaminating enzyme